MGVLRDLSIAGIAQNLVEYNIETRAGEHKPEYSISMYGLCEEAEEAGKQRVQGSSGSGRGYPTEMVPSARDGNGGIVCER